MADEWTDRPQDRRSMFRLGFRKLMEPVAAYIEQRVDLRLPVVRTVLRPPGALAEEAFLERCYRCGNCAEVCPARAIRRMPADHPSGAGTPYVDADLSACVVCDELACMRACPSGALQRVVAAEIAMGLAQVDLSTCVRSRGESCTLCVDKCPAGDRAIGLNEGGEVVVRASGCVGCGVCQFYCPTRPKSIVVRPLD